MYAELKPCSANLADGVVCESAMAYPPPPPGGSATALSPPPPPPPIGVATSMSWFTRKEVIPRTSAICLAGLVETDLAPLCTEFANMLATGTRVGTVGSFTPLCHRVCFHSCSASSNQDRDGFENCRSPECADTLCSDFLLTECPSATHTAIQALTDRLCYAGMPFPPPLPAPSPRPPSPPLAPPPLAQRYGQLRLASAELPSDEDCAFVTYAACRDAAVELGTALKLSTEIEISLSACERGDDTQSCFLGCSLGASSGAPATYSFLTAAREQEFGRYMHRRCAAHRTNTVCVASTNHHRRRHLRRRMRQSGCTQVTTPVDSSGHATAFYKWVADDVRMPERLRTHPDPILLPWRRHGAAQCARHCSGELGGLLVAFSVGGMIAPRRPRRRPRAPEPPSPPPTPQPPRGSRFHGATDVCSANHIYSGPDCRDGGVGSIYPPLCNYGTQNTNCGPRLQFYDNNEHMGDNSCEFAHNNICEDSGPGSEYFVDEDGIERARCGYATDMSDCPARKMESLGDLSFTDVGSPPVPTPPPLSPASHPRRPTRQLFTWRAGACRGPHDDTGTARARGSARERVPPLRSAAQAVLARWHGGYRVHRHDLPAVRRLV